jgi:hypothetical protein
MNYRRPSGRFNLNPLMKLCLLINLPILLSLLMVDHALGETIAVTLCRDVDAVKEGSTNSNSETTPSMPDVEQVMAIEQKLSHLGYDPGEVDGNIDSLFECALIAFQKMNGLKRDGKISPGVIRALQNPIKPRPAEMHKGIHSEADLERQVMTVYLNNDIVRVLPISSGSGKSFEDLEGGIGLAKTPIGNFDFFAHSWGIHKDHLGELFNPVFFHVEGYAVHGDLFVPPYPASHGCLRIPIKDSEWFVKTVPLGSPLLVSKTSLPYVRSGVSY